MKQRLKTKTSLILAIETSCDETAAAVLEGDLSNPVKPKFKLLSSVIKSQISIHKKTGGVVPEVAARAHMQNILPVVSKALADAKKNLSDIDFLAATAGPGLIVSLIVGVEFAKGLSLASQIPLLPVNHMAGHLYSALHEKPSKAKFPILNLIVSGGHTMLVLMTNYFSHQVIGSTIDDAAGEAFDKVARLLKLPYPGGPEISKIAAKGKKDVNFPRPMLNENNFNFSFSGLKTAVLYHIQKQKSVKPQDKADIAMSFQNAAIDVLTQKSSRAIDKFNCKTLALSGGVAANTSLRESLTNLAKQKKIKFIVPDFSLCTDNAAMIAVAGYFNLLQHGSIPNRGKIQADPSWELFG